MGVGFGELSLWSVIMASARGAGLMLVPFFLGSPAARNAHHHDSHALSFANFSAPSLLAASVIVHTLGYLITTALIAFVFYEILVWAILRHAWLNIELGWMVALIVTGLL